MNIKRVLLPAMMTIGLCFNGMGVAAAQTGQDWPTRPVTMVVPLPAGGLVDVVGRLYASRLSEQLGKPVIVENIGGAGGMTGAARVAKAAPDGYQFLLGTAGTHAQNQTLYKRPLYNAATDFAPVALVTQQPLLLATRKDFPANNLQGFIAHAKANQATMQYASGGAGSPPHLACALLNSAIGVNVTHVPYRGVGAGLTQDLIAGRVDYFCPAAAVAIPLMKDNLAKAIAIFSRDRSPILPELATAHEQGLVDFEADSWTAFFMPQGTPAAIVRKLNEAAVAAMNTPAMQEQLRTIGITVPAQQRRSPEYLQKFVVSEIERSATAIKAAGVTLD
jgi:tripartite-type tricarboxylate transporter receptor subunit TctC